MPANYFEFKKFKVFQDKCAMKVTTDACLFGAFVSKDMEQIRADADVLDIGTGTGLLSLMVAQENEFLKIDAIEVDEAAAEQAKENFTSSPWSDRLHVIHADANSYSFVKNYDVIVSNPPFYENELRSGDEKRNVALHGQALKLNDTLSLVSRLLKPHGVFYVLLPYKREKEIGELLKKSSLIIQRELLVKQSIDSDYFRIILKGAKDAVVDKVVRDEISIWNTRKEYTVDFVELLKNYYLYL